MTARPEDPIETHFEESGSLARPMPIGRLARLGLGVWLLTGFYTLAVGGTGITGTTAPASWTFWAAVAFAFYVTPYVVNIGFTRGWKRRPQFVVAGLAGAAVAADMALYGTWWAPPLGIFMQGWLLYVTGHLGGSFLISSLIATPGCEMRAIPHLWTVATGRSTKEHYCPGPLDKLDAWERRRAQT